MEWVLWMIAVGVLGLAAVAASGRLGELPGTVTDTPRPHVPTGTVTGADLRGLRFSVVVRGYSMDQVDGLLDRLARQLDSARVHTVPAPAVPDPGVDGGPDPAAHPDPGHPDPDPTVVPAPEPLLPAPGPERSCASKDSDDERPAFFRPTGEGDARG
ncbi:MAG: DivIVA domain-containing protein [Micropruina sp.]